MKRLLISLFFTALAASAQEFSGSYVGDFYYGAAGGLRRGTGFMGMANMKAGMELWRGAEAFVNGASIHGKSLSGRYLGDLQVASNIDAGEHTYLHELWFRQRFGRFSATLGLQDLNAEFMVSEGGCEFLNSSFGVPPVISANVPVPIFPLTGLGLSARWDISEEWVLQGAIFDGGQTDFDNNPHNVHWSLRKDEGVLMMGEVHYRGRYKLGAYYHSKEKNYGVYMLVDQPVTEKLAIFGQLAVAPKKKNEGNYYLGAGANYSLSERALCGLAIASVGLHRTAHKHETVVEAYYKYTLSENISFQPDVQYIINPSGGDEALRDALVGILRVKVDF